MFCNQILRVLNQLRIELLRINGMLSLQESMGVLKAISHLEGPLRIWWWNTKSADERQRFLLMGNGHLVGASDETSS